MYIYSYILLLDTCIYEYELIFFYPTTYISLFLYPASYIYILLHNYVLLSFYIHILYLYSFILQDSPLFLYRSTHIKIFLSFYMYPSMSLSLSPFSMPLFDLSNYICVYFISDAQETVAPFGLSVYVHTVCIYGEKMQHGKTLHKYAINGDQIVKIVTVYFLLLKV